LQTDAVVDVQR